MIKLTLIAALLISSPSDEAVPNPECMSLIAVESMVLEPGLLSYNMRMVDARHTAAAHDILSIHITRQTWLTAYLVDREGGGGAVLGGGADGICGYVTFSGSDWYQVVRDLEGVRI